jgi:precorrin-2/cobalt-factor-2 C20-methyltransferase
MKTSGTFFGVGLGPGDPELLTLKAARVLGEVDWIFLPGSSDGKPSFAGRIIEDLQIPPRKMRAVRFCMSRERDLDITTYARAAVDIVAELQSGHSVAWVTEGDPLFYSTFLHVWLAVRELDSQVAVEIVPGITSPWAAAARAQVPVASLQEKVAVLPAAYGLSKLDGLLAEFSTLFLLKVHSVYDDLLDRLATLPSRPQAYYVEEVGTPRERVVRDLESLRGTKLPYLSLVILKGN